MLPNGLRFVVYNRPDAPIVSFHIVADVGAFDEDSGQTGVAHFLEHMAFKGSTTVGTTSAAQELPIQQAQDEVFLELRRLRRGGASGEQSGQARARQQALEQQLALLIEQEKQYAIPNEYGQIYEAAGGHGLNASTGYDATDYHVSLPANKAELWFAMEAERFQRPVFRQLHSERKVILEERRQRVDSSYAGTFFEKFQAKAFANNYSRPIIGYERDIQGLSRQDIAEFFALHYGPESLSIAMVGDITVSEAERLANKYFSSWDNPRATSSLSVNNAGNGSALTAVAQGAAGGAQLQRYTSHRATQSAAKLSGESSEGTRSLGDNMRSGSGAMIDMHQPSSNAAEQSMRAGGAIMPSARPQNLSQDSQIIVPSQAGPAAHLVFYRPSAGTTRIPIATEMIAELLSGTRSSRLYKELVSTGQCLGAAASSSFPSDKYPCALRVTAVPSDTADVNTVVRQCRSVIEPLLQERVSAEELRRVKLGAQVSLAQTARSNSAMAELLASYTSTFGSWRAMLSQLRTIQDLTPDDIQIAAQRVLQRDNCFVGLMPRA